MESYLTDANFDNLDLLRTFAEARGHTLFDLAFAWLLSKEQIPFVIAGATHPDQVTANAAAISWKLSDEDWAEFK